MFADCICSLEDDAGLQNIVVGAQLHSDQGSEAPFLIFVLSAWSWVAARGF